MYIGAHRRVTRVQFPYAFYLLAGLRSRLIFTGSGSWLFFQAAPAPCFFFQAAPAPRSQKHPAPTGSGSGSPALVSLVNKSDPWTFCYNIINQETTTVLDLKKMIEGITKTGPADQQLFNKDDVGKNWNLKYWMSIVAARFEKLWDDEVKLPRSIRRG